MTNISNDVVQELINARAEGLRSMNLDDITDRVVDCVKMLDAGAYQGLLGIDAKRDNVTNSLWQQAIIAAEMTPDLVFPGWDGQSQPAPGVCSYEVATNMVAGRVARAILIINGYVRGYDEITTR